LGHGLLIKTNSAWVRHSRRKLHDDPGADGYVSIVQFNFGGSSSIFAAVLTSSKLINQIFYHNLGCVLIKGEDKASPQLQDQERAPKNPQLQNGDGPDHTLQACNMAPTISNVGNEFEKFLNNIIN